MMHSFSTSEFVYVVQLSVKQRSDASLSMLYEQRRRSVMPDVCHCVIECRIPQQLQLQQQNLQLTRMTWVITHNDLWLTCISNLSPLYQADDTHRNYRSCVGKWSN